MTSAYLTRSEIPLAAALSRMLEHIEAELAHDKLDAPQEERLRWRAELIRRLLTVRPIPQVESAGKREFFGGVIHFTLAFSLAGARSHW
jgi:hypothetical protein